jgi:hypothetical protein
MSQKPDLSVAVATSTKVIAAAKYLLKRGVCLSRHNKEEVARVRAEAPGLIMEAATKSDEEVQSGVGGSRMSTDAQHYAVQDRGYNLGQLERRQPPHTAEVAALGAG